LNMSSIQLTQELY